MVRKIDAPDTKTKQSRFSQFTPSAGALRQAEVNNDDNKEKYTAKSFTSRVMPVMNTTLNEGFFAEAVLVGEGPTEVGLFTELASIMYQRKQIPKHWEEAGVVVVPTGGKASIDRPVIIFQGLSIPTYFLWDADGSEQEKKNPTKSKGSTIVNQRLQRLAGIASPVDWPTTYIDKAYGVFAVDIETLCKEILTEQTFFDIRDEAATEIGYDSDKKDAFKSIECAAAFIRLTYDKYAKTLPLLEEIVINVSAMISSGSTPVVRA